MESLELIQAKLKSLDGIEQLISLQYLSIGYCRSLADLSKLSVTHLKVLELSSLSHIEQLQEVLPHCGSLLGLFIDSPGKVLPSIGFLNEMSG